MGRDGGLILLIYLLSPTPSIFHPVVHIGTMSFGSVDVDLTHLFISCPYCPSLIVYLLSCLSCTCLVSGLTVIQFFLYLKICLSVFLSSRILCNSIQLSLPSPVCGEIRPFYFLVCAYSSTRVRACRR